MTHHPQRRQNKVAALVAAALLFCTVSGAQVLTPDAPPAHALMLCEDQFVQEHYSLAASSARAFLSQPSITAITPGNAMAIDKARYMLAVSCLKTGAAGGVDSAINERELTPNPVYKERLAFALAHYYFKANELSNAIPLYIAAGTANLGESEVADARFELAYCYFNNKQFDKAEPLLVAIKELKDSKYYMAGNYYYGLLVYNKNKYKEALQSFDRVKDAGEYMGVVPYYIAEIYYFMAAATRPCAWPTA